MKIENIQVLRGPNIWSVRRKKLIQMRLNLQELEHKPTNEIPGFYERLKTLIPSLYEHRCSPGVEGGFFQRIIAGTWMGHVIEHIALEIQTLAGMDTGFGRTRETKETGVYNVVFTYIEEKVGIYAAEASVRIAEALIFGTDYDPVYETQRIGLQAFKADVPDGKYEVTLHFAELQSKFTGETLVYNLGNNARQTDVKSRVFDVLVNGQTIIKSLSGSNYLEPQTAFATTTVITVQNGLGISVDLKPLAGQTILNGVQIKKIY